MRLAILLPLALGMAGCHAADRAAQDGGNAADAGGSAVANVVEQGAAAVDDAVSNVAAPADRDAWIGRWTGVEGTYLVVSKGEGTGHYALEMQYTLDDKGSFAGVGTDQGITFRRPDGEHVLRVATGDETGLKYLAGKKDCLIVKQGEGYCRD